jgi:hypothetical protein|tara:strand:+ start:3784 stop:4020 length:237 start_codon:yes stop_codon:yes gene_type:complete
MINQDLKSKLDNFLGKDTNISEISSNPESEEVCDLDTGICYTVRTRDGLIERVENSVRVNRKINVESPSGDVKQLLNG